MRRENAVILRCTRGGGTKAANRDGADQGDRVYTWAGGGVVADSNVDAEYQESLDKAAAMLAVMGEGTR